MTTTGNWIIQKASFIQFQIYLHDKQNENCEAGHLCKILICINLLLSNANDLCHNVCHKYCYSLKIMMHMLA